MHAEQDYNRPLTEHLVELRTRLLYMIAAILLVFVCLLPFADNIYTLIATPLLEKLPSGSNMIATEVASPFLTPVKLCLFTAVLICAPWWLYQIWLFVAPGLYKREQRVMLPLLCSSTLLFYTGCLFAWFIVLPLVFTFFIGITPDGVQVMTDIQHYLNFIITLLFAFGIAFEIPVATVLLVRGGLLEQTTLRQNRAWVILGAFVVGMLLTPPDVISQILLALPVWLLFECGLWLCRNHRGGEEK